MAARGYGEVNRNFWLGVYNGILTNGAEAFFHSTLVLAPFLAKLGAPAAIIGLIPAIRVGGWFLPQLFVASRLAHQPFKLPWYRRMSLLRVIAYGVMLTVIFLFGQQYLVIMVTVLAMLAIISIAGGISGIPFADVTAKVVPHYRLGTFWALRNIIGGVLALAAGLLLRRVLESELPFPHNFGYVIGAGTLLAAVAFLSFSLMREPSGEIGVKQPFRRMLRRVPGLLRQDVSFRRYLRLRLLALMALLADPFYAIHVLHDLDAPTSALGLFVILSTSGSITANLLFRRPADSGRNVTVLQVSIVLLLIAPLAAILIPDWRLFSLVFMISAAGQAGMGIAAWNLLYAVAPASERPLYVGTANSILSLPSLTPIFAGVVVDVFGFRPTFALAALLAATALLFAFRLSALRALDRQAMEASR